MDRRAMTMLRELARDDDSSVVVRGDCMAPLLASGAQVRVRAKRVYLPGDVVVFRTRAGALAAHRVLGWRPAGLVTKGDHCVEHDPPVDASDIVGAAQVAVRMRDRIGALRAFLALAVRRMIR